MKIPAAALAALVLTGAAATAQIAVSANDGEIVQVDGRQVVPPDPEPDTATIIDLSRTPPRVLGEVEVRTSVVGSPESVAIAGDRSFALITVATKIDPVDPTKYVPDNTLSVVDLKSTKPGVMQASMPGSVHLASRPIRRARWRWSAIGQRTRFRSSLSRAER